MREIRARTIEQEDLVEDPCENVQCNNTSSTVTEPEEMASPHLRVQQSVTPIGVSPLNFPACPRGPGRPKLTRTGAPKLTKKSSSGSEVTQKKDGQPEKKRKQAESEGEPAPKKRRGRPPGSKNKSKSNDTVEDLVQEGDVCNICGFELNHPSKKDKAKDVCKNCKRIVHKPCLEKYDEACICSMGY